MTKNRRSKSELIEECLKRGLPVTNGDSIETLNQYLTVANELDYEDKALDQEFFNSIKVEHDIKEDRSFFSKLFFFFG